MIKSIDKHKAIFIALLCICNLAWGNVFQAHAAAGTRLDPNQIDLPSSILINTSKLVYVQIFNDGVSDVEGQVSLTDNGVQLGVKPFSARASGRPEEVWFTWRPTTQGDHKITIQARNDAGYPDLDPTNNTYTKTVFVDVDTDGDGIPNALDPDDDNDGVPDKTDQFPLDPSKSLDTDHDGMDDSIDSDDDNDGLYDHEEAALGTNPKKYDTDGDGVGDKQDAFPLDPKRSKADPPVSTGPGSGSGSSGSGSGTGSNSGSGSSSGTGASSGSGATGSGGNQTIAQDSGSSSTTTVGSAPNTLATAGQVSTTRPDGNQVVMASAGTSSDSGLNGVNPRVAGVSDTDESWVPLQTAPKGGVTIDLKNQYRDDADRKKRMLLWLAAGISALVTLIFFLLYFLAKRRKEEKKGK